VLLGTLQQRRHQHLDGHARGVGPLARVHRQIGHHLVVARARGVQLAPDRSDDLGEPPLDCHMDVFVVGLIRKRPLYQLALDLVQAGQQLVAVRVGDDPSGRQHPCVGTRLRDVLRPQAPVEPDRGVQALKVGVLGLAETGHGRSVYAGTRGITFHQPSASDPSREDTPHPPFRPASTTGGNYQLLRIPAWPFADRDRSSRVRS